MDKSRIYMVLKTPCFTWGFWFHKNVIIFIASLIFNSSRLLTNDVHYILL